MIILYGIPNCDTVKKARAWLTTHGISYSFYDFKTQGVPANQVLAWCQVTDWSTLINQKGTTWRKLAPEVQNSVVDANSALALMQAYPSVIKRPIITHHQQLLTIGFDAVQYASFFPIKG